MKTSKNRSLMLSFIAFILAFCLAGCSESVSSSASESDISEFSEISESSNDESSEVSRTGLKDLSREEILALELTGEEIAMLSDEDARIWNELMAEINNEYMKAYEDITAENNYYDYQPCVTDMSTIGTICIRK